MNNGGIRTELAAGPLTWGQLYQLQPFANRLINLKLTGTQLKEVIEHVVQGTQPGMHISGLTVDYDPQRERGSRVLRMQLADGTDVRSAGEYTVTVNDFLADGGDGLTVLTKALSRVDPGIVDLDALIAYVQKLPQPMSVDSEPRFRTVR